MRFVVRGPVAGALAFAAFVFPAYASNGLNLIGYGAESSLMAGADTAAARDAAALNTNPAGLGRLLTKALDIYGAAAFSLDVGHTDRFGNDLGVSNKVAKVAGFGYAQPIEGTDLVLGAGAFVQGGMGAVFERMTTPFGTTDELSSLFGAVKLTGGGAYKFRATTVGVAVSVLRGAITQKVFPETSVVNPVDPAQSFFGTSLEDAEGSGYGLKLGILHDITPEVSLGAVYTSKSRLPLEKGRLDVNMSAAGLGRVRYNDTRIDGLAFPQALALGVAWRPSPAWLWSGKLEWLDWSNAEKSSTLTAAQPDNPAAPATIRLTQTLGWRNQWVIAVGVAVKLDDIHTLRAGVNYARNPIPPEHSNPLMNAIAEKHVTFGLSRKLGEQYELFGGIEYQPRNSVRYFNPELPFGANAEVRNEYLALHLMLSRRW